MPIRFELTPSGGPSLREIALRLRAMNEPEVGRIFRRNLRTPVASMRRDIRLRIMAIKPGKHTRWYRDPVGLRVRLARCVRVTSRTTAEGGTGVGKVTTVAVFMDVERMPPGQYALPLTEEGIKVWRHPVFGHRDNWVGQEPNPYFYPVVAAHGGEARMAVDDAVREIKRHVDG